MQHSKTIHSMTLKPSTIELQNSKPPILFFLLSLSFGVYYLLAYQTLRTEVYQVFSLFGVLFLLYGFLYQNVKQTIHYRLALIAAILFRFLILFALPNLSDDFFRFNWDGRLLSNGISPFEALPVHFIDGTYTGTIPSNIHDELYSQLNSPEYFTIYPPICQFIFWWTCALFPNDLYTATLLMKFSLFAFEVGSIYLLHQMVKILGITPKRVLLYALNPLVIVELTGNLHFEATMIFFILLAIYCLLKNQWIFSAIAMGLAISSKLIPLIFLPFLIRHIGFGKSILYGILAGSVTLLGFLPLFTLDILRNLFSSIGLYFQKFEFNASIYYLVRWYGFEKYGYNIIQTAGIKLAKWTFVGILTLAFWRKGWFTALKNGVEKWAFVIKNKQTATFKALFSLESAKNTLQQGKTLFLSLFQKEKPSDLPSIFWQFLFALTIYFAFANIVHPWYVSSLVALCIFTSFRFPILWSGLILLTYYTYLTDAYTENLYLVAIEYIVVYTYLIWELIKKYSQQKRRTLENY